MKMKKFTANILAVLTLCLLCLSQTACSSSDNNVNIPSNMCFDFATFVSSNEEGSVFTLRKSNDSELVTLTSTVRYDTKVLKPGTRVIIQYVPAGGQKPYESGPITLFGVSKITDDDVTTEALNVINSWPFDRVRMMSITRSGEFIDVWAEVFMNREPKRFVIVADAATVANEYPDLYMVFQADNSNHTARQLYGSFDMSSIWNLTTCKGVNVHYSTNSGNETVKFEKSTIIPIEPDPID